jgi:hypothetical protein
MIQNQINEYINITVTGITQDSYNIYWRTKFNIKLLDIGIVHKGIYKWSNWLQDWLVQLSTWHLVHPRIIRA